MIFNHVVAKAGFQRRERRCGICFIVMRQLYGEVYFENVGYTKALADPLPYFYHGNLRIALHARTSKAILSASHLGFQQHRANHVDRATIRGQCVFSTCPHFAAPKKARCSCSAP